MNCQNCGNSIHLEETFYRAGLHGTVYCSTECCHEAYDGFYTKEEVDKTIERHTRYK